MKELTPYIFYNGDCRAAFEFYSQVLNLPIDAMMTYREAPDGPCCDPESAAEIADKIMHASMRIGVSTLMASDSIPGHYRKPQGVSISLQVESAEEAERLYAGLSAGGEIQVPLTKTFWAERFGSFTDSFGVQWMINCDLTNAPLGKGA